MNSLEKSLLDDLQARLENALLEFAWVHDNARYDKVEWGKIVNRIDKAYGLIKECQDIGKDLRC